MTEKLYQNEQWLREQYLFDNKNIYEIAAIVDVNKNTIWRWLIHFNIPRRTGGSGRPREEPLKDGEWLRIQYVDRHRTTIEIANELGVSDSMISRQLRRFGIPARCGSGKSKQEKYKIESWLKNKYQNERRSQSEIAKECNVRQSLINYWMNKFGIPRRSYKVATAGDKNPRWRGGVSFEPYCTKFNNDIKESVRDAFGRRCYLCGEHENGYKLNIHHVDYNKSQGCRGLKWSLVPLCKSCHMRTNARRWYWFALLRDYWLSEHIDFDNNRWSW